MVGVPGRSKGCSTCRSRKKGCDLRRPTCGQCNERGFVCGGYDVDRVFVYQNLKAGDQTVAHVSAAQHHDALVFAPPLQQGKMFVQSPRKMIGNSDRDPHHTISASQTANLVRSAHNEKRVEAFVRLYNPGLDMLSLSSEGREFLRLLPILSVRDSALQSVLQAIGTATLGQSTNDANLMQESRSLYGQALKETAVALRDSTRANSDAFLAVPRIMSLYEILFGATANSTTQAKGFLSHAVGETALIISRGPEAYSRSDVAYWLFTSARYRSLIAAMRNRKAHIFNQEPWKTLPWKGREKQPMDSLVDIMFNIPEILEAQDCLSASPLTSVGPEERKTRHKNIMLRCWTLHNLLQSWHSTHANAIYTPPNTTYDCTDPVSFPDMNTAGLTVRYWVASILLYVVLNDALKMCPDHLPPAPVSYPRPILFARLITRSVSYFFQAKYGAAGATTISFPLGIALTYFRNNAEENAEFMKLVMHAWNSPNLPSAIKNFLSSMRVATDAEAMGSNWKAASPQSHDAR